MLELKPAYTVLVTPHNLFAIKMDFSYIVLLDEIFHQF